MESQNISAGGSGNNNNNSNTVTRDFLYFITQIFDSIGIQGHQKAQLIDELRKYNQNEQYLFLNNQELNTLFSRLLEADVLLNGLISEGGVLKPYMDTIGNSWNNTIQQLGKLQALSILKKINKDDCGPVVDALLGALNQKIGIVNNLIESNLQETPKTIKYPETRVDIPIDRIADNNSNSLSSNTQSTPLNSVFDSKAIVDATNQVGPPKFSQGSNLQNTIFTTSALGNNLKNQGIVSPNKTASETTGIDEITKKYFAVGGSDNLYKVKYLKYKQKYLELKNNL